MNTFDINQYNQLSEMFLPRFRVGSELPEGVWEQYAKKNFCVIVGMVMANGITADKLQELAKAMKESK